jgi:predicted nucleic acid-binding protein
MTRLFLDTNVILDLLAERKPFYEFIAKLATIADQKKLILVTSPLSFTTVEYILKRNENAEIVIDKLRKFKIICEVCDVNEEIVEKGLNSNFKDFEDSIQYYSAVEANCSIIITRNGKDYKKSSLPILTAEEYLKSLI